MPSPSAEEAATSTLEQDVASIRGAIALVASGVALHVILCELRAPHAAAARVERESRVAGVPVAIVPGDAGGADVVVGPPEA